MKSLIKLLALFIFLSPPACSDGKILKGFSGEAALEHVSKIISVGPRIPGTPGSRQAGDYIVSVFTKFGIPVVRQDFSARTPRGEIKMANIVATLEGSNLAKRDSTHMPPIIVLGTHYDTKIIKGINFVGANDGGSGAGVLIELAKDLKARLINARLYMVFFDGEESIEERSPDDWFYGSKNFVNYLKQAKEIPSVKAMILLDMVGDKDFMANWDLYSNEGLLKKVEGIAKTLGYKENFFGNQMAIRDDHTLFIEAGIPSIDIIDFNYGGKESPGYYWHTAEDTIDKLSTKTLKLVGDVVLNLILELDGGH
jgi:glutaminyl-peptide cyclotransferase